ncbi:hypothetical protein J5TS1_12710 [Bacillus licheniformis]|nr:hypothetical protein BLHB2_31860 [Bacillus licheniformis]GIN25810.1 hypothetical protein J31TS2_23900 [Bacillus licheniformis]GIN30349.1 hypothetical protein J2TS5_23880 [Bacillus licheniformis]GIN33768.1 hypothetical protein J5TS1_12710 [Bacillus licheniformis]
MERFLKLLYHTIINRIVKDTIIGIDIEKIRILLMFRNNKLYLSIKKIQRIKIPFVKKPIMLETFMNLGNTNSLIK